MVLEYASLTFSCGRILTRRRSRQLMTGISIWEKCMGTVLVRQKKSLEILTWGVGTVVAVGDRCHA